MNRRKLKLVPPRPVRDSPGELENNLAPDDGLGVEGQELAAEVARLAGNPAQIKWLRGNTELARGKGLKETAPKDEPLWDKAGFTPRYQLWE